MLKISLNNTMKVKLNKEGIDRFLEYVDNLIEELSDKYSLTDVELVSYQMMMESKLKDGYLTAQLSELFKILSNNPAKYMEDTILELEPGELSLYNDRQYDNIWDMYLDEFEDAKE